MDMTIDCPHCGTPLRVPESAAGRRGRCIECDQRFSIPSLHELLDATVSHFMVASIDAQDEAEDAFDEAVTTGEFASTPSHDHASGHDAQHITGETVMGIPIVTARSPGDTASPILSNDTFSPPGTAPAPAPGTAPGSSPGNSPGSSRASRSADQLREGDDDDDFAQQHGDLIDIADDIQHDDLYEDALAATPNHPPLPPPPEGSEEELGDGAAPRPAGGNKARYPDDLRPTQPRPYLVVQSVGLEGVTLAFDANWLKHEVFRTSMPQRCAFSGQQDARTLIARAMIFHNKHQGQDTPLHSLETRHELSLAANPSPRGIVRAMGRLEGFNEPFDFPILHYVHPGSASNSLYCSAETRGDGITACSVLIPHHRTALEWIERVNGRCGPEYTMLKTDLEHYASDAWRRLPDKVRQRLSIWCQFAPGERFGLYLNDADFTTSDAGLAGVVITDRRFIYHKFRRSRSISLNQDALLHISVDSKIARLTLQSHGRAARCGKIHKADLPQLIQSLADAPKLQVQVRKSTGVAT